MNIIAPQRSAQVERDPVEVARGWLDEHGRVALATVVSTWGSAPVPTGGQLVIAPDERFEGSVSGGCVEADVIAEAASVMADRPAEALGVRRQRGDGVARGSALRRQDQGASRAARAQRATPRISIRSWKRAVRARRSPW